MDPELTTINNEMKEILVSELKNLAEADRLFVGLFYYENLSYEEIAEILGTSIYKASQNHERIIKVLKEKLDVYLKDSGNDFNNSIRNEN